MPPPIWPVGRVKNIEGMLGGGSQSGYPYRQPNQKLSQSSIGFK
jgi:hypothetical protein